MNINEVYSLFDQRIEDHAHRVALMKADSRIDEANFEKIKLNIYEVFKTVLSAAQKQYPTDEIRLKKFFSEKLLSIPRSWEQARATALVHADEGRAHTEDLKLEAAADIKQMLADFLEEKA